MQPRHQAETLDPMRERIASELDAIERIHHVRILYACESGSRAWGFASKDSDYDVRFIYVHDSAWYLQLGETRDVIEWALDEVLDINGWDLSKALRLMRASNPTIIEWLGSPIIYRERDEFALVRNLADRRFHRDPPFTTTSTWRAKTRRPIFPQIACDSKSTSTLCAPCCLHGGSSTI